MYGLYVCMYDVRTYVAIYVCMYVFFEAPVPLLPTTSRQFHHSTATNHCPHLHRCINFYSQGGR